MIQRDEIIHQINCQPLQKNSLEAARGTSSTSCFIGAICKPTTSTQGLLCLPRTLGSRDTGCACLVGPHAFQQGVCGTVAFFGYLLEKPVGISKWGRGETKVNKKHTVPKVHESLKHRTVHLRRVPGHPGHSLGRLSALSRLGRCKQMLTGSSGHLS